MVNFRDGFNRLSIVGFLFENKNEGTARFISNDSKSPSAPELFRYDKDNATIFFDGMTLIAGGDTQILKDVAQRNPEAVKAFLRFGHMYEASLYRQALSNEDPNALKDVLVLMNELMPEHAFGMVYTGILENTEFSSAVERISLEHVAALAKALKRYPMSDNERDFCADKIREFAALTIDTFSQGSLKSTEDYQEMFAQIRTLFDDKAGNELIKKTLEDGLIQSVATNRRAYNDNSPEQYEAHLAALNACMNEAERVGVDLSQVLTSEDELGRTLLHDVAKSRNVLIFQRLVEELENQMGEEKAKEILQKFLNKNIALIETNIGHSTQYVRHNLDRDMENYDEIFRKLNIFCPPDNSFVDSDKLRAMITDCQSYIYQYLDASKDTGDFDKGRHQALRTFADGSCPIVEGQTVIGHASGDMLEYLLGLKEKLDGLSKEDLAEAYYQDMLKPVSSHDIKETAMHEHWAGSTVLGPPGSEKAVNEYLSDFVLRLDKVFGTDIAVPLVAKLFALTDGEGKTPLENTLYDGPEGEHSKYYYPVMVKNLAAALEGDEKFTRYMDEAITPNLPVSFGGKGPQSTGAAAKYLKHNRPT